MRFELKVLKEPNDRLLGILLTFYFFIWAMTLMMVGEFPFFVFLLFVLPCYVLYYLARIKFKVLEK